MQTQKDHVHAHSFLMGRMSTALVIGEISGPDVPGQRTRRGFVIGVVLAVLILIGFLLYGLIVHERGVAAATEQQATRPQPVGAAPTEVIPGGPGAGSEGASRHAVQGAESRIARTAGPPAGSAEEG